MSSCHTIQGRVTPGAPHASNRASPLAHTTGTNRTCHRTCQRIRACYQAKPNGIKWAQMHGVPAACYLRKGHRLACTPCGRNRNCTGFAAYGFSSTDPGGGAHLFIQHGAWNKPPPPENRDTLATTTTQHEMHMHMHARAHACTCMHTHAHVCTRMHMYAHACTHTYAHAHTRMHTHTQACTCTHTHAHTHTRMHTHTHTHAHAHTRMHMHTHAYTCTHTYARGTPDTRAHLG